MTSDRRMHLRTAPTYRFKVERGQPLPTLEQAFKVMYALKALNESTRQTAIDLLERVRADPRNKKINRDLLLFVYSINDEDAKVCRSNKCLSLHNRILKIGKIEFFDECYVHYNKQMTLIFIFVLLMGHGLGQNFGKNNCQNFPGEERQAFFDTFL